MTKNLTHDAESDEPQFLEAFTSLVVDPIILVSRLVFVYYSLYIYR